MTIYAAGVVCWREVGGKLEFLLVHREKYNDWGFAKGKLDPGEVLPETAVREVMEETGIKVRLGRKLSVIEYQVDKGENKEVHYWASKVTQKAINKQKFTPNQEIAKVEWHGAKEALSLLSYEHDRDLLENVILLHKKKELETRALIILRHATATPRSDWKGEEAKRPLLPEGIAEAKRLVPILAAYSPKRLVSSPWKRCQTTIAPYGKFCKRTVIERHHLTELGNAKRPKRTFDVVNDLLGDSRSALICSHRPALPSILNPLASRAPKELQGEITAAATLKPGDFAVARLTLGKKPKVVGFELVSI
ncbi:MAG: NUDIX hydrolase [Aquiluna sp.]|nr:NUDIX hydrolase [Aquiluna sp.]MCF8545443.1 NUDIX hydrolase [Aquiluna sp.]